MYSSSNTKPCNLLLLVELKGSGKTFTGSILEKHLDVKFLRIEPIFLELLRQEPELVGIPLEQRGFPGQGGKSYFYSATPAFEIKSRH